MVVSFNKPLFVTSLLGTLLCGVVLQATQEDISSLVDTRRSISEREFLEWYTVVRNASPAISALGGVLGMICIFQYTSHPVITDYIKSLRVMHRLFGTSKI